MELITELTADCYIAALNFFLGRRALPTTITSDNGTNFVSADKILDQEAQKFIQQLKDDEFQTEIVNYCSKRQITSGSSRLTLHTWAYSMKLSLKHLKSI